MPNFFLIISSLVSDLAADMKSLSAKRRSMNSTAHQVERVCAQQVADQLAALHEPMLHLILWFWAMTQRHFTMKIEFKFYNSKMFF